MSHAVPAPGDPHVLYRHFDTRGTLLYIGISGDFEKREGNHKSASMWRSFLARTAVEQFEEKPEVIAAERVAIETEHPVFNKHHNDTPEARARLRAYLKQAGLSDLMRLWSCDWCGHYEERHDFSEPDIYVLPCPSCPEGICRIARERPSGLAAIRARNAVEKWRFWQMTPSEYKAYIKIGSPAPAVTGEEARRLITAAATDLREGGR